MLASNVLRKPPLCFFVGLMIKGLPNFIASASFINLACSKHILIGDKLCYFINGYHVTIQATLTM